MTKRVMHNKVAKSRPPLQSSADSAFERVTQSMRIRGPEIPVDTTASLKRARLKGLAHDARPPVQRKAA